MVLTLIEHQDGNVDELSLQALTLARNLASGEPLHALLVGDGAREAAAQLAGQGVGSAHVADDERVAAYAPGAWAQSVVELVERLEPSAVVAAGTNRGNEVLAHVAALRDLPFAANCTEVAGGSPLTVTRVRWGGSLLEEARIHGAPTLLSVAPHMVPATDVNGAEAPAVEAFTPTLGESDLLVQVAEHESTVTTGVSLAEAKVVVSGGRGVGSADGFGMLEELADLLGAAVGCSRVVTSAGWRPHTDQVGQTGTKVSPDLYIACGISGATQHIAGCKGAKKILAINSDAEAPILASADYAVIGDLSEIVPALTAELRKARGP
ncbi:MAG TPA: electron transfer flavoprotein subunit alpha/FixB family protein [Thermoleophilaceae bacterium]